MRVVETKGAAFRDCPPRQALLRSPVRGALGNCQWLLRRGGPADGGESSVEGQWLSREERQCREAGMVPSTCSREAGTRRSRRSLKADRAHTELGGPVQKRAGNVRVVSMAAGSDPRPAGRGSIAQGTSSVQSAGGRGSTRV